MAEQKYIDADKVIKLLRKDLICKYPSSFSFVLWATVDEIAKMDGEDVRPVKRGKWEKRMEEKETPYYKSFTPIWSCSECGTEYDPSFCMTINFCPNCGADMRTKEDNHG